MRLIAAVIALLAAWPALAQDKAEVKDVAAIKACVKSKTGHNWAWERCIGVVSERCVKDEASMPPSEVVACYAREQAVWDDVLNQSYKTLREKLDEEQVRKLRDMQRAWIASRDKICGFIYDYFEGSMASPMIAACTSRATGMQALFLLGFANDIAERK